MGPIVSKKNRTSNWRTELAIHPGLCLWHHCYHTRGLWGSPESSRASSGKIQEAEAQVAKRGDQVLVSTTGIPHRNEYFDCIRHWQKPTTRNKLRAFIWWFPLLSMFPPCPASVLRPLKCLLSKKRTMAECFADHDGCFEGANSLFNDQELVHIDHEVTIDVHIDASAYGIGRLCILDWITKGFFLNRNRKAACHKVNSRGHSILLGKKVLGCDWSRSFAPTSQEERVLDEAPGENDSITLWVRFRSSVSAQ